MCVSNVYQVYQVYIRYIKFIRYIKCIGYIKCLSSISGASLRFKLFFAILTKWKKYVASLHILKPKYPSTIIFHTDTYA